MNTISLKALVVDDDDRNREILAGMLHIDGHSAIEARNGLEAIRQFLHEDPDVILMDVRMPEMDGIEAARHIRDINSIVPILFISAQNEAELAHQGADIGSDFIQKPVDFNLLRNRLIAHRRSIQAWREIMASRNEAWILHQMLQDENIKAAGVLQRMVANMLPADNLIGYKVLPSGIFSGDIVLTAKTPSGRIHVMLADAVGHGLPAAFSLMPIIPVFEAMTRKGFPLLAILAEMNKTLCAVMPVGRFIAVSAASIEPVGPDNSIGCVWVGGNPSAHVVSGGTVREIKSSHLALGISTAEQGEFESEIFLLGKGDRIVMASDGLTEAWDAYVAPSAGSLAECFASCGNACLLDCVFTKMEGKPRHDDATLVVASA